LKIKRFFYPVLLQYKWKLYALIDKTIPITKVFLAEIDHCDSMFPFSISVQAKRSILSYKLPCNFDFTDIKRGIIPKFGYGENFYMVRFELLK
ncbi:TPA: hypothetical protein DCX15_02085, partial [bacterium]|nr:hypothetical protein [bacterium]